MDEPIKLEDVRSAIAQAEVAADEHLALTTHKDRSGDGPIKQLARLREIEEFIMAGAEVRHKSPGIVMVDFLTVALLSKKLRFPNNSTWYRYPSAAYVVKRWLK